jgi:hypothetical protein
MRKPGHEKGQLYILLVDLAYLTMFINRSSYLVPRRNNMRGLLCSMKFRVLLSNV